MDCHRPSNSIHPDAQRSNSGTAGRFRLLHYYRIFKFGDQRGLDCQFITMEADRNLIESTRATIPLQRQMNEKGAVSLFVPGTLFDV